MFYCYVTVYGVLFEEKAFLSWDMFRQISLNFVSGDSNSVKIHQRSSVRTVCTDRPSIRTVRMDGPYGRSVRTVRTDGPYGPSGYVAAPDKEKPPFRILRNLSKNDKTVNVCQKLSKSPNEDHNVSTVP